MIDLMMSALRMQLNPRIQDSTIDHHHRHTAHSRRSDIYRHDIVLTTTKNASPVINSTRTQQIRRSLCMVLLAICARSKVFRQSNGDYTSLHPNIDFTIRIYVLRCSRFHLNIVSCVVRAIFKHEHDMTHSS